MNNTSSQIISLLKTILLLFVIEILSSSLFPSLGLANSRIVITILFTLFFAIRIQSNFVPFYILIIHLFHSAFSIEGWAIGTFSGLSMALVLGFLRGKIQVNSYISTSLLTFVFHLFWLLISTTLICLKLQNFELFTNLYFKPLIGVVVVSVISPFFFIILENFWKKDLKSSEMRF